METARDLFRQGQTDRQLPVPVLSIMHYPDVILLMLQVEYYRI